MTPTVSVVIATYNWSAVLRHSLASALGQRFADLEVIVVGDACTDDTEAVVASYGDPRVRFHNRPENAGSQSAPNNDGIALARGEYVAYLGHDDLWFPDHLELLVGAAQATGADLTYSVCAMVGPPGSDLRVLTGLTPDSGFQHEIVVPPSSLLHRRELTTQIGPWRDFRDLHLPPDRELVLRAHAHGKRFAPVRELTAIKLNSAWRPGSYRERPSHEQAAYAQAIAREPERTRYRETLEAARMAVLGIGGSGPPLPPSPEGAPPGWQVAHWRRIRGLDPLPGEPASPQAQH